MKDEIILGWQSPEHHFDKKSKDWYWILALVCAAISFLAFYFGNFLFGVFVIIAGFTLGIFSYKETRVTEVRISPRGITFGRYLHPWLSYKSFWIEDEHIHGARILLNPTNNFLPLVIIPINENVDLNDVRDILLEFLEEEPISESIVHKWFDKLLAK
ncbi:MAG: hypothetical protein JW740_01285 [Candidatus Zambryskibacteria bacterium]|nr:hypothetical protein [Candidatus Zambryskibacteria bacterium]